MLPERDRRQTFLSYVLDVASEIGETRRIVKYIRRGRGTEEWATTYLYHWPTAQYLIAGLTVPSVRRLAVMGTEQPTKESSVVTLANPRARAANMSQRR